MEMAQNVSIPELTEAISARLLAQWEAWKSQDAASNNAIIADDFNSFWPDGSRHIGKPTAQQIVGVDQLRRFLRATPLSHCLADQTLCFDLENVSEISP